MKYVQALVIGILGLSTATTFAEETEVQFPAIEKSYLKIWKRIIWKLCLITK